MPSMSRRERMFCQSAPWRFVARRGILPWAFPDPGAAARVLELGSGSGAMAEALSHQLPDGYVTATDVDPQMVETMRQRFHATSNVRVEREDGTALSFEGEAFDAVASFLMLHHVIDWEEALVEIARVLRPGGCFVGYDLTESHLAARLHQVSGSRYRLISPSALADFLEIVGFSDIELDTNLRGHVMRFNARKRLADG